jgi:hypothetical protein
MYTYFYHIYIIVFRLDKLLLKQNKLPELGDILTTISLEQLTTERQGYIGLLIKFLTVYLCITFHFFALALGGKGVFYSYKKILMLHFCN